MAKHKFRGKARLSSIFRHMPRVARDELRKSLERSATELVAAQKALVPVDRGALRDSIAWTDDPGKVPAYAAFARRGEVKDREYSIIVTAGNERVRTAHLVEFGSAPHINQGQFPGTQNPGTEPRPFFFPAWRLQKKRIAARARAAARRAFKKARGQ